MKTRLSPPSGSEQGSGSGGQRLLEFMVAEEARKQAESRPDSPVLRITDPIDFSSAGPEVQDHFDFMTMPRLPVLTPEEKSQVVQDMVTRHNLHNFNLESFSLRPSQHAGAETFLAHTQPEDALVLQAGTGIGKTVLFLLKAHAEQAKGYRSVLVVPLVNLAVQVKAMFDRFTIPNTLSFATCTGRNSKENRIARYRTKPDVLVVSAEVLSRDFNQFNWDRVSLVALDEPQLTQRKDGSIPLVERIRNERPRVLRLLMSATLAPNEQKLNALRASAGQHRFYNLLSPDDIAHEQRPAVPLVQKKHQELFDIPLARNFSPLVSALRTEIVRCVDMIQPEWRQLKAFEVPKDVSLWVPAFDKRQKMATAALRREDDGASGALSLWSEGNKWATLFTRASQLGRFAFLESYFYRYAQRHLQRSLYLPEIEGRVPKAERGVMSAADKRILGRETVHPFIKAEVAGTPFAALLKYDTWEQVLENTRHLFEPLSKERPTESTQQRWRQLNAANLRLDAPEGKTEQAREFFDQTLRFMAHRGLSDSLKMEATSELLQRHLDVLLDGRSFIFTTVTRHADFLAEVFEYRFRESGMAPVSIHGKTPRREQERGMNQLRSGEKNILITTSQFAGTGIDLPNARMGIVYAIMDANPMKLIQPIGRVVGRAESEALVYFLSTQGTLESKWYMGALKRYGDLRSAVSSRAEAIIPAFALP